MAFFTPNPWKTSPKNLATWYLIKDTMYVTPNVDMILLSMSMFSKYEGDYLVYISKEELMPLIPLLKNLMTDEMVETIVEQSGGMLKEDVVRKLPDWIAGAQYFDVGLFFNKQ